MVFLQNRFYAQKDLTTVGRGYNDKTNKSLVLPLRVKRGRELPNEVTGISGRTISENRAAH